MLTGLACQIAVLSFEPVSVVQPVLASGVALVLVLSRLVLRERLGARELCCVVGLAGCVILRLPRPGPPPAAHHADPGWLAAVAIPSALAGLLIAAIPLRHPTKAAQRRTTRAAVCFGVGTGLLYGVAALAIKGLSGILANATTAR